MPLAPILGGQSANAKAVMPGSLVADVYLALVVKQAYGPQWKTRMWHLPESGDVGSSVICQMRMSFRSENEDPARVGKCGSGLCQKIPHCIILFEY